MYEEIFLDQFYSVNEFFILSATYKPTAKMEAFVHGSVSRKAYRGEANIVNTIFPSRRDNVYEFKTGVAWALFDKVGIDMLYGYSARDSNINVYDFKSYSIEFGVSYKF